MNAEIENVIDDLVKEAYFFNLGIELKIAVKEALKKIEFGINNFEKLGEFVKNSGWLESRRPRDCFNIIFEQDGFSFDLQKGICDNFTDLAESNSNLEALDGLLDLVNVLVETWQKENKIKHGYTGHYISGIDEYCEMKNLYTNELRLNALKFHFEVYTKLNEALS